MAEKNNPLFDVEVAVAHGWILEFLCHMAWIHFSSLDDAFYTCRDFLQNLLAGKVESTPERQKRIKLIQLLSRLADGKDYTTRYEEDGDITALESALPIFDSLVTDFAVPEDQVSEARGLVMTQSVLVCCRGGDFQAAEQVFSRVWPPGAVKSAKGKKLRSKVQEVIRSGNPEHSLVQVRCSYDKFLTWMIQFLSLIVDGFSLPFLLKAAQRVLRARIDAGEGTEAPEESLSQSESDSDMYETPSENEAPPKEEEEFVFKSPALLRECFLVMAKEERSGSEWTDVNGYDFRSLRGDLAQNREAKTSGAAFEKDLEQNRDEKTSGSGVRKSPRKHQQAAKNSEPTERRSPRKKTSSETTGCQEFAAHGAVHSHGEKRKQQTDEENFEKTENRKKTQTTSAPSTDRNNPGRTQKSGDTGKDIRYWMTSEQPSTSGVRKKVHKQAERRTLVESDSESSEEETRKENVTQGSKKRPRDRPEYGNGVKETWSSDEETFRAPVKKKYYIYDSDSDSSESFPSALPCSAASLVVPRRLVQKREPLDITSKGQVRSRFRWAEYEVENLIKGVQEHGVGHWSEILDNYRFKNRTNVNLKDKWRQLVKSGTVREFP